VSKVQLSQYALEVLVANATPSPTTPGTGDVAVTQYDLEVLSSDIDSSAYVSQIVVEVLSADLDDPLDPPEPTGSGQHVYGYSG